MCGPRSDCGPEEIVDLQQCWGPENIVESRNNCRPAAMCGSRENCGPAYKLNVCVGREEIVDQAMLGSIDKGRPAAMCGSRENCAPALMCHSRRNCGPSHVRVLITKYWNRSKVQSACVHVMPESSKNRPTYLVRVRIAMMSFVEDNTGRIRFLTD